AFADAIMGTMYKNPTCTCCETYAAYLEKNGFKIGLIPVNDIDSVGAKEGVPANLRGCHTIKFGNYVVEGFVPADQVKKMLLTMPKITGLSMPGMPMDIPGMGFDSMPGSAKKMTYTTYSFTKDGGEPVVYDTYPKS
ncbi:MAG: CopG family transcriptional regulator, partial [Alphaproteobacteria bacterium]|nr:CopG family transcriptional regulator [Alphaproteobacteria bacterium]